MLLVPRNVVKNHVQHFERCVVFRFSSVMGQYANCSATSSVAAAHFDNVMERVIVATVSDRRGHSQRASVDTLIRPLMDS